MGSQSNTDRQKFTLIFTPMTSLLLQVNLTVGGVSGENPQKGPSQPVVSSEATALTTAPLCYTLWFYSDINSSVQHRVFCSVKTEVTVTAMETETQTFTKHEFLLGIFYENQLIRFYFGPPHCSKQ